MTAVHALIIVHLSSLDAYPSTLVDEGLYPSDAEAATDDLGNEIASAIQAAISRGERVYVIDQFWGANIRSGNVSSGTAARYHASGAGGPNRDLVVNAIGNVQPQWIKFDESTSEWRRFLPWLRKQLVAAGVRSVTIGGLWWEPDEKSGCAFRVYDYLRSYFKVEVDVNIVGSVHDAQDHMWGRGYEDA